jgi:hypothetical protein
MWRNPRYVEGDGVGAGVAVGRVQGFTEAAVAEIAIPIVEVIHCVDRERGIREHRSAEVFDAADKRVAVGKK